ncbi:MAG: DUF6262 family protein [bacterium]
MTDKLETLYENRKKQSEEARKKAKEAINMLFKEEKVVNFSSIHKQSGVSRSFLYEDEEIRKLIQECRTSETDSDMNRRAKYDKTSRSKDVIIAAKDKRIAKLEAANRLLKAELEKIRGLLYAKE